MSDTIHAQSSDQLFWQALEAKNLQTIEHNLPAYLAATILLTCPDENLPTVEQLGFGGKWIAAVFSDGRSGRAFAFNEAHAVYGDIPSNAVNNLGSVIDMPADQAIASFLCQTTKATDPAEQMLYFSAALALGNALSSKLNHPEALHKRGFEILESSDCSFLQPNDQVVLIGAGMLLSDAANRCRAVDVIDMRPVSALQTVVFSSQSSEIGPRNVRFHDPSKTPELLAQADVVGITGCAFANGSLFDLIPQAHKAREIVLFGPSAQLPMELIAQLGVTKVLTSCEENGNKLLTRLKAAYERGVPNEGMRSYLVSLPPSGIEYIH